MGNFIWGQPILLAARKFKVFATEETKDGKKSCYTRINLTMLNAENIDITLLPYPAFMCFFSHINLYITWLAFFSCRSFCRPSLKRRQNYVLLNCHTKFTCRIIKLNKNASLQLTRWQRPQGATYNGKTQNLHEYFVQC